MITKIARFDFRQIPFFRMQLPPTWNAGNAQSSVYATDRRVWGATGPPEIKLKVVAKSTQIGISGLLRN